METPFSIGCVKSTNFSDTPRDDSNGNSRVGQGNIDFGDRGFLLQKGDLALFYGSRKVTRIDRIMAINAAQYDGIVVVCAGTAQVL